MTQVNTQSTNYLNTALAITTGIVATGGCVALGHAAPAIKQAIETATPIVTEAVKGAFTAMTTAAIAAKDTWIQTASENYIAATVGTGVTLGVLLAAKKSGILPQEKSLSAIVSGTAKVALIGVGSAIANVSAIAAAPTIVSYLNDANLNAVKDALTPEVKTVMWIAQTTILFSIATATLIAGTARRTI